jgi:hypothetical protein
VVAFTAGRLGAGRRGEKAWLKAESDPQIGKPTGYEKKIEFKRGQATSTSRLAAA